MKHIFCCCFNCDELKANPENPDCACDMAPVFNEEMCGNCPISIYNGGYCHVPRHPDLYDGNY